MEMNENEDEEKYHDKDNYEDKYEDEDEDGDGGWGQKHGGLRCLAQLVKESACQISSSYQAPDFCFLKYFTNMVPDFLLKSLLTVNIFLKYDIKNLKYFHYFHLPFPTMYTYT